MKVVNRDLQRHLTYIVGALYEKEDVKSLFLLTLKEGGGVVCVMFVSTFTFARLWYADVCYRCM